MTEAPTADVTSLLTAWQRGDDGALDALMARVYPPLRRIAAGQLRDTGPRRTLETAALVNEAFLRLVDQTQVTWRDRVHFFSIASRIMRRVVVDHARRRAAVKRGGATVILTLGFDDADAHPRDRPHETEDLLALEQALDALTALRPELARLVELRFFGGLTKNELAVALDIAPATVTRRWRLARAWLHRYLEGEAIVVG